MKILIALILLGWVIGVGSLGVASFGAYTLIDRIVLTRSCVTSLSPKALLTQSRPHLSPYTDGLFSVSEIIWLPCPFAFNALDDADAAADDDHFASRLCDKGYRVHVVEPRAGSSFKESLMEVVRWRVEKNRIPGGAICIVANELTCTHVLNYLSDVKLSILNQYEFAFYDIGAVVLVDPPPLHALSTPQGRKTILRRYVDAIRQCMAAKKSNIDPAKKAKKARSRRQIEREKQALSSPKKEALAADLDSFFRRVQKKGLLGDFLLSLGSQVESSTGLETALGDLEQLSSDGSDMWNTDMLLTETLSNDLRGDSILWDSEEEIEEEDIVENSKDLTERKLLGTYPSSIQAITTEASKNRMLVINSQFPTSLTNEGVCDADNWGDAAIEELANVFKAPPVFRIQKDFGAVDDVQRHQGLADAIASWLSFL